MPFGMAVRTRVSIAVSGGTSTGKTTFLNALLKEVPDEERIVTIEDTRELKPITPNTVALLASKGDQGRRQGDAAGIAGSLAADAAGSADAGRAARRRGVFLPAGDQYRPSRLADDGPRELRTLGLSSAWR